MGSWLTQNSRPRPGSSGTAQSATRSRRRGSPAAGVQRESEPRRARALAHAHLTVQDCTCFRRQIRGSLRNRELPSSADRAPAIPRNTLASAVTAARIHATTPANSRDVAHFLGIEVSRIRGGGDARCVERVVVLGRSGAGKTTAAAQLGQLLGLAIVELDQYFWSANLTPMPPARVAAGAVRACRRCPLGHGRRCRALTDAQDQHY